MRSSEPRGRGREAAAAGPRRAAEGWAWRAMRRRRGSPRARRFQRVAAPGRDRGAVGPERYDAASMTQDRQNARDCSHDTQMTGSDAFAFSPPPLRSSARARARCGRSVNLCDLSRGARANEAGAESRIGREGPYGWSGGSVTLVLRRDITVLESPAAPLLQRRTLLRARDRFTPPPRTAPAGFGAPGQGALPSGSAQSMPPPRARALALAVILAGEPQRRQGARKRRRRAPERRAHAPP